MRRSVYCGLTGLLMIASWAQAQGVTTTPGASLPVSICAVDAAGHVVPGAGRSIWVTSVLAVPYSGGHNHDDGNRPGGSFTVTRGITQANGCYPSTFKAPKAAGTSIAYLLGDDNTSSSTSITVGRFDLVTFAASPNFNMKPPNAEHLNPWYCTQTCVSTTTSIAAMYFAQTGVPLQLNDASLIDGGQFDLGPGYPAIVNGKPIQGKWWDIPHQAHLGLNIDVGYLQFYQASNPPGHTWDRRVIFLKIAGAAAANPFIEGTHYHLRYTQ